MKYVIHVNRQFIAQNAKDGKDRPVFTIKHGGKTTYCRNWVCKNGVVKGIGTGKQLKCGARAYIEVEGDIEMIDAMTWEEAKNV